MFLDCTITLTLNFLYTMRFFFDFNNSKRSTKDKVVFTSMTTGFIKLTRFRDLDTNGNRQRKVFNSEEGGYNYT